MPKIDIADTTAKQETDGKRWVEVPEKDLFDFTFPTIRINLAAYGPGKHYVDEATAVEIERAVKVREQADLQVMRPGVDKRAIEAMVRNGAVRGGQYKNDF